MWSYTYSPAIKPIVNCWFTWSCGYDLSPLMAVSSTSVFFLSLLLPQVTPHSTLMSHLFPSFAQSQALALYQSVKWEYKVHKASLVYMRIYLLIDDDHILTSQYLVLEYKQHQTNLFQRIAMLLTNPKFRMVLETLMICELFVSLL